jgi:amidohydrolase
MALDLKPLIREILPETISLRHNLHRHPELAYQEHRTTALVARQLDALGIQHIASVARGTGVVAHLPATSSSAPGAVALRADMDALPITERSDLPYASEIPGLMHACGHDGHTANLLGVATVLSRVERRPNPVTFIFQPAEEGGAGGKAMCEAGALDGTLIGPRVDRIFGLHGWPQLTVGQVGSRPGPLLAATDTFKVTVRGRQSHAAYPQFSADPIVAAAACITALQSIVARNVGPLQNAVVSVCRVSAGTALNVLPEEAKFAGTARSLDPEVRVLLKQRIHEIAAGVAEAHGCRAEIKWREGYPVTRNDPDLTERFFAVARQTLGAERVVNVAEPTMGGEDFAYYGAHVPACFFILGVCPPGRTDYPTLHQPDYNFNDDALATGIELMCRLALA